MTTIGSASSKWEKLNNDQRGVLIRQLKLNIERNEKGIMPLSAKTVNKTKQKIDMLVRMNNLVRIAKLDEQREAKKDYYKSFC